MQLEHLRRGPEMREQEWLLLPLHVELKAAEGSCFFPPALPWPLEPKCTLAGPPPPCYQPPSPTTGVQAGLL